MRSALLLAYFAASVSFALGEHATHNVTISDLENLHRISGLAVSPDGKQIAYCTGGELYLADVNPPNSPARLTSGVAPSWSPDGRTLAYYAAHEGSFQLSFLTVGQPQAVTTGKSSLGLDASSAPAWSPDGTKVLVTVEGEMQKRPPSIPDSVPLVSSPESPPWLASSGLFRDSEQAREKLPARRQIRMFTSSGDMVSRVSQDEEDAAEPAWSPDGKAIAFLVFRLDRSSADLVRLDLGVGSRRVLAVGSINLSSPRWSPDGRDIAFSDLANRYGLLTSAFVVSATDRHPSSNITKSLDRNVEDLEWLPNRHTLVVIIRDGVNQPLGLLSMDGQFVSLSRADAARHTLAVANTGLLVWVQSDPEHLDRIFVRRIGTSEQKVAVDPNPQITDWQLGQQRVVRWHNSRGEELEGILVLPPAYRTGNRVPLIVDAYSHRLNEFMGIRMLANQYLAAQGYALFFPNHRGFFVFPKLLKGDAYAQVAQRPDSNEMMAGDVLSGVDKIVRMGFADPDRLALYGFSTGASAVDSLLTNTARFRAAISTGGVADWFHYYLLRRTDDDTIPSMFDGRTPGNAPSLYLRLSPLYHAVRIHTPLLLVIGDKDTRLLDSVLFYHALRRLDRPVVLVRYPDQGHGFWGSPLEDYWSRSLTFLKEHGM